MTASTSAAAAKSRLGPSCKVDPGHTKLQDQEDSDDPSKPWKRNGDKQVTIYFSSNSVPAKYKSYMKYAAKEWSRSACVEVKVMTNCSGKRICVPVKLSKVGGGDGNFAYSTKGKYMTKGSITFDSAELSEDSPDERRCVVLHEMGHGLGLDHRETKESVMYGSSKGITSPDTIDFQNLRVLYGKQD